MAVDGGSAFVRTLARRLSRFVWDDVEHDVMKVLYESVIAPDTRHRLGECYTPDWLAASVVDETVTDPLGQRVLDRFVMRNSDVSRHSGRVLATVEGYDT